MAGHHRVTRKTGLLVFWEFPDFCVAKNHFSDPRGVVRVAKADFAGTAAKTGFLILRVVKITYYFLRDSFALAENNYLNNAFVRAGPNNLLLTR